LIRSSWPLPKLKPHPPLVPLLLLPALVALVALHLPRPLKRAASGRGFL
jgi:hypothetical protein